MARWLSKLCGRYGHDWLYRRLDANRRYCRRCGLCEYLAFFSTRYDVHEAHWVYESSSDLAEWKASLTGPVAREGDQ